MPPGYEDFDAFVAGLRSLIEDPSAERLAEVMEGVRPEDLAEAIIRLDTEEAAELLERIDPALAADALVEMPTETARQIFAQLPDETLAHYLDILPMDDALDFREELGAERFDDLLELIPNEDAQEIRRLLVYPEDSVARLMTERFFEVRPETTMAELLADIRLASEEKYETVNDVYVLTPDRHLVGVFGLRKAIRSTPSATARDLMREDVISVRTHDDAEDAARRMQRYGFYALPVLDPRGRMVGLFTGDDAVTLLREAETEDVLALGAVSGNVDSYLAQTPWQIFTRRIPWLAALFVAENLTSFVMSRYAQEGQILQAMIFVPLLIGAGGNSGSQVVTMVTRALAIGEITPRDSLVVLRKEVLTSTMIGLTMGILGYIRAGIWGIDPGLMLAIGCALPLIILWSCVVGSMLPLGAKKIGIDPAVMSAPFISTFVDATGLIIYFEIVKLVFGGQLGPPMG